VDQTQLAEKLYALTGAFKTPQGGADPELDKARSAVAATIAAGLPADSRPAEITVVKERSSNLRFARLEPTDQEGFGRIVAGPALGFIANSPIVSAFGASTPAWARGMALESLGPFEQTTSFAPYWVFIPIPLARRVNLKYGSEVAAVLTIEASPVAGRASFRLAPGSIWIAARLLAAGSPASSWAGLRIKGGTLTLGQYSVVGGEIVLNPATKFALEINLDPPAPPSPVIGPGVDASLATVNFPASIKIEARASGAEITNAGEVHSVIYGSATTLKRNLQPIEYQAQLAALSIPCDITGSANFAFATAKSTLFKPSGSARILSAGWVIPVTITTPDKLGQAAGTGAAGLLLDHGPTVEWSGLSRPVDTELVLLTASPGEITVIAGVSAGPVTDIWQLWNGKLRPSTAAFTIPTGGVVLFLSVAAPKPGELFVAGGSVIAHLDRPVQANGLGVPVSMPVAVMFIVQSAAFPGGLLLIEGAAPQLQNAQAAGFALENAFIEALPPQLLLTDGLLQGKRVNRGALLLDFGLTAFVPTLPDPYATNAVLIGNPAGSGDSSSPTASPPPVGTLVGLVGWLSPDRPILSFELLFDAAGLSNAGVPFPRTRLDLLDVSSNADQFGVSWNPHGARNIQTQKLFLIGDSFVTSLFTLPAISWEPMFSADPIPAPPSDGVASRLNLPTVALVPIAPVPLMEAQQEKVAAGAPFSFTGSLPFGMEAEVFNESSATYEFVEPSFDGYEGGHQISLIPANAGSTTKPEFAGQTILTDPYGTAVLSSDVATIFRNDFSVGKPEAGVPVARYDLSGYGASLFSEWIEPNPIGSDILKVQFTVWVGRTAYEVVKAQSIIYPWGIKAVRTITIQRLSGGGVLRSDSGWQAATPGLFAFPSNTFDGSVHQGSVNGVFNVRNIRDNGAQFTIDGITWVPVLFDADVKINQDNPVVLGATADVFITSRDIVGYLQLGPDKTDVTRSQLADLLQQKGAASGPLACTVNVGKAGQQMKVSLAEVSAAGTGASAVFVAALRGTPVLPRDGQWSMAVKRGAQAPVALDPQTAVPLIQPNGDTNWHFADPSDILNLATPNTQYGFLQGTSTQKTFFARPQIGQGANSVSIPDPPHIADVGSLLGATGIFPDLAKALSFPSAQDLVLGALGADTLTLNNLAKFPISQPPLTLVDFGAVKVVLVYQDRSQASMPQTEVTFNLDPGGSPRWSIKFEKFTFVLVSPFGDVNDPLLQVVGSAEADADHSPKLSDLQVVYGSILTLVEQIFSKLNQLASFLPGNKSFLDVSLSNGQLTVRDKFALPTLPLGIGDITNVALDLGATMTISPLGMAFTAGIASPDQPFQWLVSPLSGTGCVVVGFQNNNASLLIQAGIGAGLAIDVGVAEGSASIVLAFQVDNTLSPFEVKVILTGQASVDVLGGLASAAIMLSAGLAIIPALPDITLIGSVAVGIHISICWVVSVDFDGSWQFSQTLTA
jgi:hypothetical protein